MFEIEDFTDERQKTWCIHCNLTIANVAANRDHVPTQSLLSKGLREAGARYDLREGGPNDYLPQVFICKKCNSGFSQDESYVLCVLHAVTAGSLYPDQQTHKEAANVLRSNRHIVRLLKTLPDGQLNLFQDSVPFTIYPDVDRIKRIIVKNARGHAYHEIGEPMLNEPNQVSFIPIQMMSESERDAFESIGLGCDVWPEVGSRMMVQVIGGQNLVGGWTTVEHGRYRYAVDWTVEVMVRTVIWDYLATETRWQRP
jgi:hypothetical protein